MHPWLSENGAGNGRAWHRERSEYRRAGIGALTFTTINEVLEGPKTLGFVEGLNNKIRVLQRRAYGLRDEQYLRLKILTCMLAEI